MRDHDHYVYIVTNKHRSTLYIGMTNSLVPRISQHKRGEVAGLIQRYQLKPPGLVRHFRDVGDAIACEKRMKGRPAAAGEEGPLLNKGFASD